MLLFNSSHTSYLLRCMVVSLRKRAWQPILVAAILAVYLTLLGVKTGANLLSTLAGTAVCVAFICVRSYLRHRWD